MEYEIVIGLEVHVQLLTKTKMFCSCPNHFTHEPNTHVCPVCLGQPGSLPVVNHHALELGIKGALAMNCAIPPVTKFDRKHYYYPDLPKNIQISQFDMPISEHGWLDVTLDGETKRIGITRAHLEEDAGKLVHGTGTSSVDLNRTGTPLLEIVSDPDLGSPQQARAYLELLKLTIQYTGVSDCNMEEGSLRCDANVSVRPVGQTELGVKNEIKNMNSFRGVEAGLQMVIDDLIRQSDAGETIQQVTWGYSLEKNKIFKMRVKEYANDYRYFPEPDLPPITVSREWVEEIRATLQEMPGPKKERFLNEFGLSEYDAGLLVQEPALAAHFEDVVKTGCPAKQTANIILNDITRELHERKIPVVAPLPISVTATSGIITLLTENKINGTTARSLIARYFEGETAAPNELVEREGLAQVADATPIKDALEKIIADNPQQVAQLEGGKTSTAMWFVGQIMRAMKGKAAPDAAQAVIAERFGIDPAEMQSKKKK